MLFRTHLEGGINAQKELGSYPSPNQTYEVTTYLNNGGATVEWLNDRTVKINGVVLDVEKDTYDYRRQ